MKQKRTKKTKSQDVDLDSLKNQLARALADYDNLRKRVEKERGENERLASVGLTVKLLPVFDMLEQAQKHVKDSGLAIAIKEFEEVFASEGVERIDTKVGDKFDENLHEAVDIFDVDENLKGKVAEVLLTGWRFKNGPVIRYVRVKVK